MALIEFDLPIPRTAQSFQSSFDIQGSPLDLGLYTQVFRRLEMSFQPATVNEQDQMRLKSLALKLIWDAHQELVSTPLYQGASLISGMFTPLAPPPTPIAVAPSSGVTTTMAGTTGGPLPTTASAPTTFVETKADLIVAELTSRAFSAPSKGQRVASFCEAMQSQLKHPTSESDPQFAAFSLRQLGLSAHEELSPGFTGSEAEQIAAKNADYVSTAASVVQVAELAGAGEDEPLLEYLIRSLEREKARAERGGRWAPSIRNFYGAFAVDRDFEPGPGLFEAKYLRQDEDWIRQQFLGKSYAHAVAALRPKVSEAKQQLSLATGLANPTLGQESAFSEIEKRSILRHMMMSQLHPGQSFLELDADQAAMVDLYVVAALTSLRDEPAGVISEERLKHAFCLSSPTELDSSAPVLPGTQDPSLYQHLSAAQRVQQASVAGSIPLSPEEKRLMVFRELLKGVATRVSGDDDASVFAQALKDFGVGVPQLNAAFQSMWDTLAAHNPEIKEQSGEKALYRATLVELFTVIPFEKLADYGAFEAAAPGASPEPQADMKKRQHALAQHTFSPEVRCTCLTYQERAKLVDDLGLLSEVQFAANKGQPKLKAGAKGSVKSWSDIEQMLTTEMALRLERQYPADDAQAAEKAKEDAGKLVKAYWGALTWEEQLLAREELASFSVIEKRDSAREFFTRQSVLTCMINKLGAEPLRSGVRDYLTILEAEGQRQAEKRAQAGILQIPGRPQDEQEQLLSFYDNLPHLTGEEGQAEFIKQLESLGFAGYPGKPSRVTLHQSFVHSYAFCVSWTDDNGKKKKANFALTPKRDANNKIIGAVLKILPTKGKLPQRHEIRLLVLMTIHNAAAGHKTFRVTGPAAISAELFRDFARELLRQRPHAKILCEGAQGKTGAVSAEDQKAWLAEVQAELVKERAANIQEERHQAIFRVDDALVRHREPSATALVTPAYPPLVPSIHDQKALHTEAVAGHVLQDNESMGSHGSEDDYIDVSGMSRTPGDHDGTAVLSVHRAANPLYGPSSDRLSLSSQHSSPHDYEVVGSIGGDSHSSEHPYADVGPGDGPLFHGSAPPSEGIDNPLGLIHEDIDAAKLYAAEARRTDASDSSSYATPRHGPIPFGGGVGDYQEMTWLGQQRPRGDESGGYMAVMPLSAAETYNIPLIDLSSDPPSPSAASGPFSNPLYLVGATNTSKPPVSRGVLPIGGNHAQPRSRDGSDSDDDAFVIESTQV